MGQVELQMGLNRDARWARLEAQIRQDISGDGSSQNGKRVYVLCPDQATYRVTKRMVDVLGNQSAQKVDVIDFRGLLERFYSRCGHRVEQVSEAAKLLLFSAAMIDSRASLRTSDLLAGTHDISILESLVSAVDMLSACDIDSSVLAKIASDTEEENPMLAGKLRDIGCIWDTYAALAEASNVEAASTLQLLSRWIGRDGFLDHTVWYVVDYNDLTTQQHGILNQIISLSDKVVVDLHCAGLSDTRDSSRLAVRTGQKISMYCAENDIPVEATRTGDISTDAQPLRYMQEWLCDTSVAKPADFSPKGRIALYADGSVSGECRHVAGTILKAIRHGYRYKDVSIVLCDHDRYAPTLESVFGEYNIPLYMASRKDAVSQKQIILGIYSALDAVTQGMQMEAVLDYLRSGLSGIEREDVDVLENYIMLWHIWGRGFTDNDSWTMHPGGYGLDETEESSTLLEHINTIRSKAITPLLSLKSGLESGKTVGEYALAFSAFLDEVGFVETMQGVLDTLTAEGRSQDAMEYGQIPAVINEVLEDLYSVLGTSERPQRQFVELFRLLCGVSTVDSIPTNSDQVEVSGLADARYVSAKLRVIIGAEEGMFPVYEVANGLINSADAKILGEFGYHIPGDATYEADRQYSEIATVIAGAKDKIIFSFCTAGETGPSYLFRRIQQLFPTLSIEAGAGEDNIYAADLLDPVCAGRLMGRLLRKPEYRDITLALALQENPVVQDTAMRCIDKAGWALGKLDGQTVKDLYGNTISLSPTRADAYSSCRYNYFLRYGLKLATPVRAKLDAPIMGSFAHEILQQSLMEIEREHGGVRNVTPAEIAEITKRHIETYTATKMKGLERQPDRYAYLYARNCREVLGIMQALGAELSISDFHASAFEWKVGGEHADAPAIRLDSTLMPGVFTGVADRVDVCKLGEKFYYRVADYKTGSTHMFDMTAILYGCSLQLLIYEAALRKRGLPGLEQMEASGVLYVPAKIPMVAAQTKLPEDKVLAERDKMLTRRGMLLNDAEVISAMEHTDGSYKYLPVRQTADGILSGDVCSSSQLQDLDSFAMKKLADMVDDIAGGEVKANPISRGPNRTTCKYCPMRFACHKDACGVSYRYKAQVTAEEFWSKIKKAVAVGE